MNAVKNSERDSESHSKKKKNNEETFKQKENQTAVVAMGNANQVQRAGSLVSKN